MTPPSRRDLLAGLGAAVLPTATWASETRQTCDLSLPGRPPALVEWGMGPGRQIAALVPDTGVSGHYPMVIALHGAGETKLSPREGALAWPESYALARAMQRLSAPPLFSEDYEGLVAPETLLDTNRRLAAAPWSGVVVVCPRIGPVEDPSRQDFARWLVSELVPEAVRRLPVLGGAASTGIDGVSLGGRMALDIGLAHPEVFSAVGTLQAALRGGAGPDVARRLQAARQRAPVQLRLTTSGDDLYRDAVHSVHENLLEVGLSHDYSELVGPHGYAFNRGPGGIELLSWHDRVLAHG